MSLVAAIVDNPQDTIKFVVCLGFFKNYYLWNHSYKNSSKKYSFKCEIFLFASMLTYIVSDLLNSRFITSEVHEGKSVEVKAGASLFQNLSLSHKLLTPYTNIPKLFKKFRLAGAVGLRRCFERWEVSTPDLILFSHVWMISVSTFVHQNLKKYWILYFQNIYCSIFLGEINSIMSVCFFIPGFLMTLYTNPMFASY